MGAGEIGFSGEIAVPDGVSEHLGLFEQPLAQLHALVGVHEEGFVLDDRTADQPAVLVADVLGWSGARVLDLAGNEAAIVVAKRLEGIAMKLIGTALGDSVTDAGREYAASEPAVSKRNS